MRKLLGEPWHAWLALLIGVLAVTAQTASSITVSVLMKTIVADFGWSRAEFASAATVRLVAMVLVMPFAGQLTDRLGARAVLAGGAALAGACVFAMAAVQSLPQLWAVSVAMGPAQAFIGSIGASALVLRLFDRHRGFAVGVLNGGDNLLNAGVPLAATALLEAGGWRLTLGTLGIVYFALALLVMAVLGREDGREAPRDAGDRQAPPLRVMLARDRRLWVVFAVFAAVYAYITSLQLHFHAFQTDSGLSPELAARLLSMQILVGAVGAPLFGWLAERTSARMALVCCVAGLGTSAGIVTSLHSPVGLAAWAVFHGLVNGGVVAVLALVLHELSGGAARIGSLLGFAMAICMAATLIGNQWSAWMFDQFHSYAIAWQVYTGLLVCALPGTLWLLRAPAVRPTMVAG